MERQSVRWYHGTDHAHDFPQSTARPHIGHTCPHTPLDKDSADLHDFRCVIAWRDTTDGHMHDYVCKSIIGDAPCAPSVVEANQA